MLSKFTIAGIITATVFTISTLNAIGQESDPLTLSLEVSAEYDNNITVDALDLTSQQGDGAILFDGMIGYALINSDDSSLKVDYNFSQSLHSEQTEFDLQTHGATVEATTKLLDIDLGIAYSFYDISLGNEDFLQMHIIRPYITMLLSQKILLIGSYEYLLQNFQQPLLLIRDSIRHSADVKTYFILGYGRTINLGYKLSRSDAMAAHLDYWGHKISLGFKLPIAAINKLKFTTRYRYNQKNYSNINPVIGDRRKDKRHSIQAAFETPVMDQFTVMLQYEYTDSTSNLQSLNYSNHLISFKIGWEL